MKKTGLSFLMLSQSNFLLSQPPVFVYAPDGSSLTVLLNGYAFDSVKNELMVNFEGKWNYEKGKEVKVFFRGKFMAPDPASVEVKFNVFGKSSKFQISSEEDFLIEVRRPIKKICQKPAIKWRTKKIKNKEWSVIFDSIDIGTDYHDKK